MKNKGFTLIELLATVIVLSIIVIIIVPAVNNVMSDSKEKAYLETKQNITDAARLYVLRNMTAFPTTVGNVAFVNIQTLKDEGLLKTNLADPRDGQAIIGGDVAVSLNSNGSFDYTYRSYNYVQSGLVLLYDAINHGTINTVWNDLSGNGKNGTLANFAFTTASGWQDNYLSFGGLTETITAINPLASQTTDVQAYTVLLTINMDILNNDQARITGINNGLYISYVSGKGLHYINAGANDYYAYTSAAWPTNENMQVAFRFYKNTSENKMKVEILKNGVSFGANNFAENLPKLPFGMAANIVIARLTNMKLYSIKIYNRVLTDAEVKADYNVDKERFNF